MMRKDALAIPLPLRSLVAGSGPANWLDPAERRMWRVAPEVDWAGRTLDEMCPPLLADFI